MGRPSLRSLSWLGGVLALAAVVWYFRPDNLLLMIRSLGGTGIALWLLMTLAARMLEAETTVASLRALGHRMRRVDAFWIGWVRTFFNQLVPTTGIGAYAHAIRRKTRISWSELAALAAPQYVLVATALGLIGVLATISNADQLKQFFGGFLFVYSALIVLPIVALRGAASRTTHLPAWLRSKTGRMTEPLLKLVESPGLVIKVIACHSCALLLRGSRIWLLFAATGLNLDWRDALLIVGVAETSMLLQLTPGGLGIREAAVVGGAALAGVAPDTAIGVALVDRGLVIAATALLVLPALVGLRSGDATTE